MNSALKTRKPSGLVVNAASLKPGIHTFSFQPLAEDLELDPSLFANISVEAQVSLQEGQALVQFDAAADAALVCDRTLKPFTQRVLGSYQVLFTDEVRTVQAADLEEDLRPYPIHNHELVITDAVRDTLLLAIPIRKIAPDAEEADLPMQFGKPTDEDDIDPRWAALKGLRLSTDN